MPQDSAALPRRLCQVWILMVFQWLISICDWYCSGRFEQCQNLPNTARQCETNQCLARHSGDCCVRHFSILWYMGPFALEREGKHRPMLIGRKCRPTLLARRSRIPPPAHTKTKNGGACGRVGSSGRSRRSKSSSSSRRAPQWSSNSSCPKVCGRACFGVGARGPESATDGVRDRWVVQKRPLAS